MTRVLMVVSNGVTHDPRVAAEATSLARAGYEVTLLAWDRRGNLPSEDRWDGVTVRRLRNTFGMTLRGFDLFRLRPFWRLALRSALSLHDVRPFAVVHSHDLDTLPIGVRLKAQTGAKLVYDAHEVFPYLVEQTRARWWAGRFAALELRLVPDADGVIAAGRGHTEYLSTLTRGPIAVVTNSRPLVYDGYEPSTTERLTVLYLGGLDRGRLLVPLAELAVEDPSFEVHVGGVGPLAPMLRSLAAHSRGNLRFLGLLPMSDVVPRTRGADLIFSVFDPSIRLNRVGMPNKFFEALVAGRPILVSLGTRVAEEVQAADCGLAIPYTKLGLREAIATLRGDPALRERLGRNAFRLARERYNWAREEATLLSVYRSLDVAP